MASARSSLATLVTDFESLRDDTAVVAQHGFRTRVATYRELSILARRFAAELEAREIRKGDRVVLWGENSASWVAAFFGCVLRGVLPVPLDPGSSDDFVCRVVSDVDARLCLVDAAHTSAILSSRARMSLPDLSRSIGMHEASEIEGLNENDPLQIVFTSGTTGEPKGVVHTHRNVLASLRPIEREMDRYRRYERWFHPIRILHTLPLSHVFGQFMGLWTPGLIGLELHYRSRLVAQELAEYIRAHRISVLAAVPRILDLLERHLLSTVPRLQERISASGQWKAWQKWWRFRDVHRLFGFKFWALVCGGAALTPQSENFWNALGFAVVQGYGMTETTALVSLNHPFRPARGTVGQVLPGREVRLGDDGEVLVKGETISNLTWQHGAMRAADSEWLATGDLAERDVQGNLRFRGRKKDVIVTLSGLNIYPEDLEAALMRHPAIRHVAVVEVESPQGPEPMAVVIAPNESVVVQAVERANISLAEFQRIRRWTLWPEPDFPRTSTGKLLRREIVRRLTLESNALTQDRPAEDLRLDSLGRVELQAQLEAQYGVAISDDAVQQIQTAADIKRLIEHSGASSVSLADHRYPQWPWNPLMQGLRAMFLEVIAMPLLHLLAKPVISPRPAALPVGPVLLVANHVTSYDAPFVLAALPGRLRRRVAIAMSGEMILDWRHARNQGHRVLNLLAPLEYWLVTALFNVFPLPQRSGFRRSFQHAGEAIDRGYNVLVFPEGRRSPDGSPQSFQTGVGMLWKQLNIPAVAVHLEGLGQLKQARSGWFRSGRISIASRAPLASPAAHDTFEELTERLRQAVFQIASDPQR